MPRWQRPKRQSGAGHTVGLALVLFVLLCGAALVLTGRERPAPQQRVPPAARVQQAIVALDQAGQALNTMNYGKARKQLARARATLEVLAATIKQ